MRCGYKCGCMWKTNSVLCGLKWRGY